MLLQSTFFVYTKIMRITFDPIKRAQTASERGLDFLDAGIVFEGATVESEDNRRN